MKTTVNTDRGIKNIQKYVRHDSVGGNFSEKQSMQAKSYNRKDAKLKKLPKTAKNNRNHAAKQAAIALGSDFVIKQTNKRLRGREKRKAAVGGMPKKKMTGSGFWFMVMLTLVKDILDIIFTLTIVLAPLTIAFTVILALVMLSYFISNEVKFTTRKVVSTSIAALIELIPFVSMLPLTTISLFLIKHFENSERLQKFAKHINQSK